jgi:CRISPR-associated protein Cmr2
VLKSSLDGLRESVFDKAVFDQLESPGITAQQKTTVENELRKHYGVKGKERLCGVALLKRHGEPKRNGAGIDSFFSTSHVAALPLINRLKRKDGECDPTKRQALQNYIDSLQARLSIGSIGQFKSEVGHVHPNATLKPQECFGDSSLLYDGRLLFADRLRELFGDKQQLLEAKKALRTFIKALNEHDLPPVSEPLPYYAILHADGDRMGAVIDQQAEEGPAKHQDLSRELSGFADLVKTIVELNHEGCCIYSGGDDVLALLPLHTVLRCARDLADQFHECLKDFGDNEGQTPTLSVGIAIGHHLDPLQDTLALAREAEKIAKKSVPNQELPEKNALAITFSKRSGADRTVKGSWDRTKPGGALDDRLARFLFLLLENELPDGVAYELSDLALRLKPPKGSTSEEKAILLQAQIAEAKRVLRRKQPKHGKQQRPADKVLDYFCGRRAKESAPAILGIIDQVDLENWSLEGLADEIIVARELGQAIEQAGTKADFVQVYGLFNDKEPTNAGK